jgi:TonB-dependent receptor
MTQDDIDALDDMMQNVGPNGEDAGISMSNAARNTARDFDRGRQTYTMGLQWKRDAWDVNFDWTYGDEQNDQYLRRWVMSTPQIARNDERYVTELVIDFDDQNFNRSYPTIGHLESFVAIGARGDERVGTENRYIPRDQQIHVGGLNVDWQGEYWNVNWDVGYAEQHTKRYDHQVGTQLGSEDDDRYYEDECCWQGLDAWFDQSDFYVTAGLTGINADDTRVPFDPTDPSLYVFRRVWYTLTEEWTDDTSTRIDFSRSFDNTPFIDSVMFGLAWNERDARREKARWRENEPEGRGGDLTPIDNGDFVSQYNFVTIRNYRPDIAGAVHDFSFLDNRDPVFDPIWALPDDALNTIQSNEYVVTEEVLSYYLQIPFSGERYRGNIGARYVDTKQSGVGWVGGTTLNEDNTELLDVYEEARTKRDYSDLLPSANIAFDLSDTWVLRLAGNKALTRPDPLDMTSYLDLSTIEDLGDEDEIGSGSGGNPSLQPYYTDSYDLSLEWYPETGGAYALGFFYKDVDGWIARGRNEEYYTAPVGVDGDGDGRFRERDITDGIPGNGGDYYEVREELYSIRRMVNTDGGTIKGMEFAFHQPFDAFTDSFLQYFGINGSMTYVDAKMDAVVPENNLPISLRGTSEWSGNLVFYFEKQKFSTRLAMNYRDDFLFQEAEDPDRHDEWTEGSTILDLNMDYRFNKRWVLRFSANNLTGETRTRYWQTAGTNRFSDDRDNGQYYTLELRYRSN